MVSTSHTARMDGPGAPAITVDEMVTGGSFKGRGDPNTLNIPARIGQSYVDLATGDTWVKLEDDSAPTGWVKESEASDSLFQEERNTDIVSSGPYDAVATGAANFGPTSGTVYEWLTAGHAYRVRQNGELEQVKVYLPTKTGMSAFYVKVWRKNSAGTYDLVGTSADILASITAGSTSTVAVSILDVQEGDFIGVRVTYSAASVQNFRARTGVSGVTTYAISSGTASASGYAWESQTATASSVVPVEIYMQAPTFVFIGDSIMAGHTAHYSFIEATDTTDIKSAIPYKFASGLTYQNMGVGGQTTTQIAARFAADVVALKPKWVVFNGGVNDIGNGDSLASYQAAMTAMLAAAQAADIGIIYFLILPWTNGTTGNMNSVATFNAWARTAVEDAGGIVIDATESVGVYRAGAPVGTFWDIKTEFNADGVHFNNAGHGAIVLAGEEQINGATFDGLTAASATIGGNIKVKSGSVGIGVTDPTGALHAHLGDLGVKNGVILESKTGVEIGYIYADSTGSIVLELLNSAGVVKTRLRSSGASWLNGGNIAIGKESADASAKLTIANDGIPIRLERTSLDTFEIRHPSANGLSIYNVTTAATLLWIDNSGRIAIGTATEDTNAKLLIFNDGTPMRFERALLNSWTLRHTSGDVSTGSGSPGLGLYNFTTSKWGLLLAQSGTIETPDVTTIAKVIDYQILAGDNGLRFTNRGAVLGVNLTLPASAVGMHFYFEVYAAQTLTIIASGAETIRDGATVSAGGGNILANAKGSTMHLYCPVAGEWFVDQMRGVWTGPT